MGSSKDSSSCYSILRISKKHCHDILLMVVVVNILVGLVCLYKYMGTDDKWTAEPKRREKVLALAVFLFLSTCALCWFIMRKDQQKWESEERCLVIDRPPSYESCVSGEHPPPSYFTVINTIHIV
uniref:Lipid phosphate phosphatase 1 n=1 Tax=Lygus hesperus TaxID=30085 RepID=A0A0A9WW57_LYGHE